MGRYLDIDGLSTWVEGDPSPGSICLLHGGLEDGEHLLETLGPMLDRPSFAFDRAGHGRTADPGGDFHYADMARHSMALLDTLGGGRRVLVGFSDGGIVALLIALERPDLVEALVLLGASYNPDGSGPLVIPRDDPTYVQLHARHAERSPDGREHFHDFAPRIFRLWATEPCITLAQLASIRQRALVVAGDRDIIKTAHTIAMFEALGNADLAILPDADHEVPLKKPDLVGRLIRDFLAPR